MMKKYQMPSLSLGAYYAQWIPLIHQTKQPVKEK